MDSYILAESHDAPPVSLASPSHLPFPPELVDPDTTLRFELEADTRLGAVASRVEREFRVCSLHPALLRRNSYKFQRDDTRRALFHAVGEFCEKCVSCVEVVKRGWRRVGL